MEINKHACMNQDIGERERREGGEDGRKEGRREGAKEEGRRRVYQTNKGVLCIIHNTCASILMDSRRLCNGCKYACEPKVPAAGKRERPSR